MTLMSVPAVNTDRLKSTAVRTALAQASGSSTRTLRRSESGVMEIVGSLLSGAWRLLVGALGLAQWSLSSLIGWVQQGFNYIWNFNWNSSDQTLNQQITAAQTALAGLLGAGLGNVLGYTTCGLGPTAVVYVFNPKLGLFLLNEVGEEMLQEAMGYVAQIMRASFSLTLQTVWINSYKSNRTLYNLIVNGAGIALDQIVPGSLSWIEYRRKRDKTGGLVSFADFVEESIETLPPIPRAFFENFFEEFGDACWESLYVIAGGLDNWIAEQKAAKQQILGPTRMVEVIPNRSAPTEKIILTGPENLLKQDLVSTLSHYQLLDNRDVGQFVGEPLEDWLLAKPLALRVQFLLFPYESPPFWRDRRIKPTEVTISVPDVTRGKLDWETLKTACGGANGYSWGKYLALARLDNGRQMHVYASTEGEADQQMNRLLSLTSAQLVKLTINQEQNRGALAARPYLQKDPRRVYPAYVTIFNRQELMEGLDAGRRILRGNFREKKARLPLWTPSKPGNFDQVVQEVLRYGQAQP